MAALLAHHRDSATGRSPFQPGPGKLPPYLAGRATEQAVIREFLEVLAVREAPASDIILHGPRGNGKTALLLWARSQAEALGIDVQHFSGNVALTADSLARRVSSEPRWLRWLGGISMPWIGSVTLTDPARQVADVLARRARKRPTLLAVDEAHRLGASPGEVLLNEVQGLRGEGLPVLLILAGTPDLPYRLRAMRASFWIRNRQVRMGRLEPGPAAAAIQVPLREGGRSINDEALQQVVAESHGYPFFLQLWGDLLWKGCTDPSVPASLADLSRARPLFEQRREDLYEELLDELRTAELVSVAAAVAGEFLDRESVFRERVTLAIQSALRQKGKTSDRKTALTAERVLRHLGYVCPIVHQGISSYEPGIPSLMRYVANYEIKRQALTGTS